MTPPEPRARAKVVGAPSSDEVPTPKAAARLVTVDSGWLTDPLPPRKYLLTDRRTGLGAVDKTGAWLFAAAGGAGKSSASIDLALAVAAGGTWFGTFDTIGEPGRALIAVAEDSPDDVRRRLKGIADTKGYRAADVAGRIQILPLKGTFTSFVRMDRNLGTYVMGEGLSELRELIEHEKKEGGAYSLIVVDPISRVSGVSLDKDSEAASKFMDGLELLSEAAGGLVLGVCHTNKTSRRENADGKGAEAVDVRGSSGLTDGARGVISLVPMVGADRKPTGQVVMSCTKGNYLKRWEDVILRRDENGALVPLDEVDRAIFEAERKKQTPEERRTAKEVERKTKAAQLEAAKAEQTAKAHADKEARQADTEARQAAQAQLDAPIVRAIMAKGYRGVLRDLVGVALGCGTRRAGRAIAAAQLATSDASDVPAEVSDVPAGARARTHNNFPPYPPCPPGTSGTSGDVPPVPGERDTSGTSGTSGTCQDSRNETDGADSSRDPALFDGSDEGSAA